MIVEFIDNCKVIRTLNIQSPIFNENVGVRIGDKVYNISCTIYDTNRNVLEVYIYNEIS